MLATKKTRDTVDPVELSLVESEMIIRRQLSVELQRALADGPVSEELFNRLIAIRQLDAVRDQVEVMYDIDFHLSEVADRLEK